MQKITTLLVCYVFAIGCKTVKTPHPYSNCAEALFHQNNFKIVTPLYGGEKLKFNVRKYDQLLFYVERHNNENLPFYRRSVLKYWNLPKDSITKNTGEILDIKRLSHATKGSKILIHIGPVYQSPKGTCHTYSIPDAAGNKTLFLFFFKDVNGQCFWEAVWMSGSTAAFGD